MAHPQQEMLFDHPPKAKARHTDPKTSKLAARDVRAGTLQAVVLNAFDQADFGLTIEECAAQTGLSVVSVSPRIKPLRLKNLVRDSGRKRRNSSGYDAVVWERVRE
jgi:hypothetical protein